MYNTLNILQHLKTPFWSPQLLAAEVPSQRESTPRFSNLLLKVGEGDCFQFARFHKTSFFHKFAMPIRKHFQRRKIFTLRHTKIIEGASCPNILAFGSFGPCEVCILEACLDFYILQQTSRCGEMGFGIWPSNTTEK